MTPTARGPIILIALIVVELATFSATGTRFASVENAAEVSRATVEVGLLALALTPVIVSGGIDLSVGSLMGLSAVVFGLAWRDLGLPVPLAGALAVATGAAAGAINGALIAWARVPPLIVTLGSFSLFRGLAEGLTGGVDNVTDFPPGFLALGQGYLPGGVPAQVPPFLVAAAGFWYLLHRSTAGRALVAIGYSPEGARYAGLPVARQTLMAYVLSGTTAGLAAIVYVARLGQAKADAGLGFELTAITTVVLGGTSIFGGKGSVGGTLLGLAAIALLRNGLGLSDVPAEFAGIATGALLLAAIGLDRRSTSPRAPAAEVPALDAHHPDQDWNVKNSQVALICGSILAAGLLVAATNVYLVGSIAGRPGQGQPDPQPARGRKPVTVAMMPKSKGNAYFQACRAGAEAAAKDLEIALIWDGPTDPDPARQNEVVETWITRGVDAIAVAVENRDGISSVLRKAQARGIKVITWDADAAEDARTLFVNQATPEGVAEALLARASGVLGGSGEFAIITGSLTAGNMVAWQNAIEKLRAEKYPNLKMVALRACDDLQKKAFDQATSLMGSNPSIRLFMAICTPAVPGAAEAVKQAGRSDVKVVGLGLPNDNKPYVHEGITDAVILWKTADLGYLAVEVAAGLARGEVAPGVASFRSSRLGPVEIKGTDVLLGRPFAFTRENIDEFDF